MSPNRLIKKLKHTLDFTSSVLAIKSPLDQDTIIRCYTAAWEARNMNMSEYDSLSYHTRFPIN